MAQPLNSTAYGLNFNPEEEDWGYSDVDRPGDEGKFDMAEIYYDYYFNDERRWDNQEGWDLEDDYWHPGLAGSVEHYSIEDYEDYEMEQEYERSRAVSTCCTKAIDAWEHLATRMLNIEWRDLNT